VDKKIIDDLKDIIGEEYVITDLTQKLSYFYDEIEYTVRPEANTSSIIVKPFETSEISQIMKYANDNKIIVVVRGGGTGLCGGAIPTEESIILSMERMNKVIEIDDKNMMAVLEGGVNLAGLLFELEKYDGICFPVHPGDEGAHIGGMVATNAGGARAVRHGITRNHVKGIEAVLPNGEVLNLGGKLLKDNSGYNIMNLIIGSEGTLAIVTKVILRLYPEDKNSATIAIAFNNINDASNAVIEILKSGVSPLAVEYQDRHLNIETAKHLGLHWHLDTGKADLIIILSEKSEQDIYHDCEVIDNICDKYNANKAVFAGSRQEQADILAIRSGSYEIIKDIIVHSFDMAVPPGYMPEFFNELWQLVSSYNTTTNISAHIADGNIHNDIVMADGKIPEYAQELKEKMYKLCFKYGGTITGEHGIGKLRVKDLKLQKSIAEIELMKNIKMVFDPNKILNPGTVVEI
jgi:glycolate oxidase